MSEKEIGSKCKGTKNLGPFHSDLQLPEPGDLYQVTYTNQ